MHSMAVMVGEDLDLDVPRALEIALQIQFTVPECALGFRLSSGIGARQVFGAANYAQAPPTTAGRGLELSG
jgi:hypothetical protein